MKKIWIVALAAAACGCGQDVSYHPAPQLLPSNIKKVAIRMVLNQTDQVTIEDKFTLAIRDAFLADGTYPIVPEEDSDGIVVVTMQRYVLTPIKFDATLVPTNYKLRVVCDLQFIDRASNQVLWDEKNMQGFQTFSAVTLPGGMTEEQARQNVWNSIAANIVTRTVQGFGAYTGSSSRRISADAPSTEPEAQPEKPIAPVTNPY